MNHKELLAHLLLYGADICLLLTLTLLMFFSYKKCLDRSRIFLGVFYFIFTLAEVINSIRTIATPNIGDNFVPLMPRYTIVSYLIMVFSMLYPIEILRPNWLKLKHFIIALVPLLAIVFLLYGWQEDSIRVLKNSSDVFAYINEPNVWLRLLMSLFFIPFALFVLYMPMNWRKSSMNKKQIFTLFTLLSISLLFFTINNIWRNFVVVNLFRFVCWALIIYAAYYELMCRLNVSNKIETTDNDHIHEEDSDTLVSSHKTEADFLCNDQRRDNNELLKKLIDVMECPKVWSNPNFQQEELCRIVGTNRTYLLVAIKQMHYNTFHEMLNSYRINYVIAELHKNPSSSIQQLYYQAGYRSTLTAKRNFLSVTGITQDKYIEQLEREKGVLV